MHIARPPEGVKAPLGGSNSSVIEAHSGEGSQKLRTKRRAVHGVLLLDKPPGLSSNDALQKAKWLLGAEKAGHTGTLDPLATGVLPLCFGAATKFSQLQLDADKTYEAVACLGIKTSTGDAEGEPIAVRPVDVTADSLSALVTRFIGAQRQIPPMYSALKKNGRALYEYARVGIELEREARDITVYSLSLDLGRDDAGFVITLRVACSKGTYIRTLAEDIGEALGCGAHLRALRRVAAGGFSIMQCISLSALEALEPTERLARLLPVAVLLGQHQAVTLDSENAGRFLSGMRRRGHWPDASRVVVYAEQDQALLGTAHIKAGELIPGRLLSPIEIRQMSEQADSLGNGPNPTPLPATPTLIEINEKAKHE